jgi:hypothetical protein
MKEISKLTLSSLSKQNKTVSRICYCFSTLVVIYLFILIYPSPLFKYSFHQKNITIYSTCPIGDNVQVVLSQALKNIASSKINDTSLQHCFYICNNDLLYTFFNFRSRRAIASNYPLFHSIFVANANIDENVAYNNFTKRKRVLGEMMAHEITHTLIEKRLGFWRARILPKWKEEGYAEYMGYKNPNALKESKEFLFRHAKDNSVWVFYQKSYYATVFLKDSLQMNFDEFIRTDMNFDEILSISNK